MNSAMSGSIGIVAYLALFGGIGFIFVFVNLLIGRLLRPNNPNQEKLEIYECGEPAIGSSFVQFDLRFYVVALIFIIFDVEVAFLFPWATVFGKAYQLTQLGAAAGSPGVAAEQLAAGASYLYQELGVFGASVSVAELGEVASGARELLTLAILEVLVFFVILLIGFAYVWRLGALDWIRALTQPSAERLAEQEPRLDGAPPVLSA